MTNTARELLKTIKIPKRETTTDTELTHTQILVKKQLADIKQRELEEFATQENISKILHSKQFLDDNIGNPVTFASPIIEREEQGIIYPNTINVIQGKAGVHKSRLVEVLCSSLLSKQTGNFLGFRKKEEQHGQYSVLYVDTERNLKDQYLYALQQIKRKAGYSIETKLPNFDHISLIEIPREKRFDALKQYLEFIREQFQNHVVIVLDVLTDLTM